MPLSSSSVARIVGIDTNFLPNLGRRTQLLSQRVALLGQGASSVTYTLDPIILTSSQQAGETYGFGSPIHLATRQLLPPNGDGIGTIPLTVYPLIADPPSAGAPSLGDITPTGTQVGSATYVVAINGIESAPFTIVDGEAGTDLEARIATAVNAEPNMPMTAVAGTDIVNLISKWQGLSANDLTLEVIGPDNGITFAFTQPAGGLDSPDVATALANIIGVWETLIVNCLQFDNTTLLDEYQTWGEGRWDSIVKKPAIVITGANETDVTNITAVTDARKTDRINGLAVGYGSKSMPFQIAARAVARIAVVADGNPPLDYGGQGLTGVFPGDDADQLAYVDLNTSVLLGASTSNVVDGVLSILDTIMMYHPDGENPPAYRYAVDIVKIQNIIHALDNIFTADEWNGAPLIPSDQATVNPAARSPKDAIAAVNTMIDDLALQAILSDPESAKAQTTAVINGSNPKRLDVGLTVQLSGNTNVIAITFNFGFFFGG